MTPQEGFRMKQSGSRRMRKGHLGKENESRSGWSVGQDGGTFQDETYTSGRCEQEAKGKGMTRPSGIRKSCHG